MRSLFVIIFAIGAIAGAVAIYLINPKTDGLQTMNKMSSDLPEYTARKVTRAVELTGKLDDPLWQQAETATLVDAVTGEPGRFSTEVKVLYDDTFLYVGFNCQDDYVWGTVTKRDGPIWNEETVEVFVNPIGATHQYYEINVSPKNVIFDSCILNRRTKSDPNNSFIGLPEWNPDGLRTATHILGSADQHGAATGWTAEYAIPHTALIGAPNTPPKSGDVWRINFYRIDSPERDQREHYAWSPTGRPAFHLPWRFGYLKFE